VHFLSLAFTPTAVIGLNIALDMPKVEFKSNARPSTYAYPAPLEEKKDKSREKVETAILSTTARQKKKEAEKKKDEKMEVVSEKRIRYGSQCFSFSVSEVKKLLVQASGSKMRH